MIATASSFPEATQIGRHQALALSATVWVFDSLVAVSVARVDSDAGSSHTSGRASPPTKSSPFPFRLSIDAHGPNSGGEISEIATFGGCLRDLHLPPSFSA